MPNVQLPVGEMTSFDLPRVCVMTGRQEDVTFRPVKFQWFPRWIGAFGFAPLIMVILIAVLTRRAKGELPFSEEGWQTWRRAKLATFGSALGFVAFLVGGLALLGNRAEGLGLLLMAVAVVQLVVVLVVAGKRGPACVRIDGGQITLKLPSPLAARAIEDHLSGRPPRVTSHAA